MDAPQTSSLAIFRVGFESLSMSDGDNNKRREVLIIRVEEPPCEHIIGSRRTWSCQQLSDMRFVNVPEDNSGSKYRCTAVLCDQNWLDNSRYGCVLPSRPSPIEKPFHQPTSGVTLNGFLAVLRDQGPVDVGVIQNYLQRVPLIWPFPLRVGVHDFSMQPLRRFRETKREYGA